MTKAKNTSRRQLPENFVVGDMTSLQLIVQGSLVLSEQNENGDWLFTLQLTGIHSERIENQSVEKGVAPLKRLIPVLWSSRGDGELEIVVEVGARQRLQALGLSAKQKELLRTNLASLPADEAANLLKELVGVEQESAKSTGSIANGNSVNKPITS